MDDHQRRVWSRMIDYIEDYERGALGLGALCSSLKGLLGASDLRDQGLVEEFWNHFVEIDAEHELRTEAWAPVGAASDDASPPGAGDVQGVGPRRPLYDGRLPDMTARSAGL